MYHICELEIATMYQIAGMCWVCELSLELKLLQCVEIATMYQVGGLEQN